MPTPNLIHPVPIQIKQLDTSNTAMDRDYREPILQSKRSSTVTVQGQVKWWSRSNLDFTEGGSQEEYTGYVLFRRVDLERQGITIKNNDKIIKIDNLDMDLYITKFNPIAYYKNGYSLLKCFFLDRQPANQ
jgi:hypothetical protein